MQCTSGMARWRAIAALAIAASCGDNPPEPPVATRLEFVAQPASTLAGAPITPAVRVRVLDASGNAFTGAVTVTLALGNANGATLVGTTSASTANGVATFADLRVEKAGTGYVLSASSGTLTGATSNPFDVTHGAAAKLRFVGQPSQAAAGTPFSPAVTVEIADQHDNRATGAAQAVTIAAAPNDAGATAIGTTTVDAVAGLATFDKVTLNRAGSHALIASATGLASATSAPVTVELTARARFCPPEASSGAAFASFTDAIEATRPGGTIAVCDGTHAVTVTMNRPLTVVAEHAHAATLTGVNVESHIIWVRDGGPGTYAFRDLNFVVPVYSPAFSFGTGRVSPPVGRYDQVIIENNRFSSTSPRDAGIGVAVASSSIPTAKVIVRGNTFTGGFIGVWLNEAGAVEISNNEFKGQLAAQSLHNASIEVSNGGPYVVRNNRVTDCPSRCIQSRSSVAEISYNAVETPVGGPTQVGIEVIGGSATVSRNLIRGIGTPNDRADVNAYAFKWAGILVQLASEAAMLSGNSISNARSGLWGHASRVTGSDNLVSLVRWAIETSDAGSVGPQTELALHRNDFTDYVEPFLVNAPQPSGFASCNYWGTPSGPPAGNPAWYTPFSPVPIANRPATITCQ